MANLTPTFHTPVVVKNLCSARPVTAQNDAHNRKPWDPTLSGTLIATVGMTFGATTLAAGATIDPGAVGMSEAQMVYLWQIGFVDWQ